ncbi:toxic anion resistance protein [Acetobacterium sp.]|uniref:toxic anion resistance protein n=1 Tax=Acetobacterium sp. TaxID=1872094 RepID=UPI0035943A3B
MSETITLADLAAGKNMLATAETAAAGDVMQVAAQAEISPAVRAHINEIKDDINLLDSQALVTYGVGAQREVTNFADNILQKVRAKDAGNVGEVMTDLMITVTDLDIEKLDDENFFSKIPIFNNLKRFMAKYKTVEMQLDRIEAELDKARMMLLKDIGIYDTLYQKNVDYFRELECLILAGDEKIAEARQEVLPQLVAEAQAKGDPMSAQLVGDFEDTINRFEKKVHDLKLSKTMAIQTAPQIRLIQNTDKILVDKIQTAILNTIPLWKNQIIIALGLQKQEKVLKMQREINQTTNDLITKNSEMLKQNTIDAAKESETGIVELETLKKVNADLIETINETLKIHQEGRSARQAAEAELLNIENQLKGAMMRAGQ